MTEQLHQKAADHESETETEILARQVEELIHAYDPRVIQLAAEVGSRLPRMVVVTDELVAVQSLREQIRQRIVDTAPR